MKDIMINNNLLPKQLAESKDQSGTAKAENADIKRIMNQRYDPDKSRALKNKIGQLANAGKIDPKDERELNELQKSIDDMNRAQDILEVENANLRRIIDKQSKRAPMENIRIDPEKSNDVKYLQSKIDTMGKELALLRQYEDSNMRSGGLGAQHTPEMDVESIQQMLSERDALRRKINSLGSLEDQVNRVQKRTDQPDKTSGDLAKNLEAQSRYINDMEFDIQEMQKYYEHEVEQSKYNEQLLKVSKVESC